MFFWSTNFKRRLGGLFFLLSCVTEQAAKIKWIFQMNIVLGHLVLGGLASASESQKHRCTLLSCWGRLVEHWEALTGIEIGLHDTISRSSSYNYFSPLNPPDRITFAGKIYTKVRRKRLCGEPLIHAHHFLFFLLYQSGNFRANPQEAVPSACPAFAFSQCFLLFARPCTRKTKAPWRRIIIWSLYFPLKGH